MNTQSLQCRQSLEWSVQPVQLPGLFIRSLYSREHGTTEPFVGASTETM